MKKITLGFTGQASQYAGMGRELYENNYHFRLAVDEIDHHFTSSMKSIDPGIQASITGIFNGTTKTIPSQCQQITLFALQMGLVSIINHHGVTLGAVFGHSLGEYAAATAAGVLQLQEAVKLIALRTHFINSDKSSSGKMLRVNATVKTINMAINNNNIHDAYISVINGDNEIVISGTASGIDALKKIFDQMKIRCNTISSNIAFHSPLLTHVTKAFLTAVNAESIHYSQPNIDIISSIQNADKLFTKEELFTTDNYWSQHIIKRVDLPSAINQLSATTDIFIEMGPDRVLTFLGRKINKKDHWLSTLSKKKSDLVSISTLFGELYLKGASFQTYDSSKKTNQYRLNLPTYPFSKKQCELDYGPKGTALIHVNPLSESKKISFNKNDDNYQKIQGHVIKSEIIIPGSFYITNSIKTMQSCQSVNKPILIDQVKLEHAAKITESNNEILIEPSAQNDSNLTICYYSLQENSDKQRLATVKLPRSSEDSDHHKIHPTYDLTDIEETSDFNAQQFYSRYSLLGVQYQSDFRRLQSVSCSKSEPNVIYATVDANGSDALSSDVIDSCIQSLSYFLIKDELLNSVYMPAEIRDISFFNQTKTNQYLIKSTLNKISNEHIEASVAVFNENQQLVMHLGSCLCVKSHDSATKELIWDKKTIECSDERLKQPVLYIKTVSESIYYTLLSSQPLLQLPIDQADLHNNSTMDINKLSAKISQLINKKNNGKIILLYDSQIESMHPHDQINASLINKAFKKSYQIIQTLNKDIGINQVILYNNKNEDSSLQSTLNSSILWGMASTFKSEIVDLNISLLLHDNKQRHSIQKIVNHLETFNSNGSSIHAWKIQQHELLKLEEVCANKTKEISSMTRDEEPIPHIFITGGTGGVGEKLIEHLCQKYQQAKFTLATRSIDSLNDTVLNFVGKCQQLYHVKIDFVEIDLTDLEKMKVIFQKFEQPVTILYHLAGNVADNAINNIKDEDVKSVFCPKIIGAWNLHLTSLQHPSIKQFVLFSSIACLRVSPGQLLYSSANAALILIANQRKNKGLPVNVINWGPWFDVGMMKSVNHNSSAVKFYANISSDDQLKEMDDTLESNLHAVAIYQRRVDTTIIPTDKLMNKKTRSESVEDSILEYISTETGTPLSDLSEESDLISIGIDSITAIRLISHINNSFDIDIDMEQLMGASNLKALFTLLHNKHNLLSPSSKPEKNPKQHEQTTQHDNGIQFEVNKEHPLSYNQLSIILEDCKQSSTLKPYNVAIGWVIEKKEVDFDQLKSAIHQATSYHSQLRAVFIDTKDGPRFRILPISNSLTTDMLETINIADHDDVNVEIQKLVNRTIDYSTEPSTKIYVMNYKRKYHLVISSHHLVFDAQSILSFGQYILGSFVGKQVFLEPEEKSYNDFIDHQTSLVKENNLSDIKQFINDNLFIEKGMLANFDSSEIIFNKPKTQTADRSGTHNITLTDQTTDLLKQITHDQRYPICLLTWGVLLSRLSNKAAISIGVALNGRSKKEYVKTLGHFVNVLPLLVKANNDVSIKAAMTEIKSKLYRLLSYQEFPLISLLDNNPSLSETGTFNTFCNFFNIDNLLNPLNEQQPSVEWININQQEAQFDISLWGLSEADQTQFQIKYKKDLFSEDFISDAATLFDKLLTYLCSEYIKKDSSIKLSDVKLNHDEDTSLFKPINLPHVKRKVGGKKIQELFGEHVSNSPNQIALIGGTQSMTYKETDKHVNRICQIIESSPITLKNTGVIIFMPTTNSIEFLISVIAIWRLGGYYIPIDASTPKDRVLSIIHDSCANLVISSFENTAIISDYINNAMPVFDVSKFQLSQAESYDNNENQLLPIELDQDDELAYVLFTSGSTGKPKGVPIGHKGLSSRISAISEEISFTKKSSYLASTSTTFDVSLVEFCVPLSLGGTIVVPTAQSKYDICSIINTHSISHINLVPSQLALSCDELSRCNTLCSIVCAGENLPTAVINKWLSLSSTISLYNFYGPTEATIYSTLFHCNKEIHNIHTPIGKPIANLQAQVLDSWGRKVGTNMKGFLHLSGEGIAYGYIGLKTVTKAFYQVDGIRTYNTGDVVYVNDDNEIIYIGRVDSQIKLNGKLMDLSEIESHAFKHQSIKESAVFTVKSDITNDKTRLVCCITPKLSTKKETIFREYLRKKLPDYMIPHYIISTNQLLYNSAGKVDTKRLQKRFLENLYSKELDNEKDESEPIPLFKESKILLTSWQEVLGLDEIQYNSSFRLLGGDSLSLINLMTKLRMKGLQAKSILPDSFCSQINILAPEKMRMVEILSRIWKEVLHTKYINFSDNIYSLGGDHNTLKNIRDLLIKEGVNINSDLPDEFIQQVDQIVDAASGSTSSTLVKLTDHHSTTSDSRPVFISPAQKWFLEHSRRCNLNHWTLSVELQLGKEVISAEYISNILLLWIRSFEELRCRYSINKNNQWEKHSTDIQQIKLTVHTIQHECRNLINTDFHQIINKSIDINKGELVCAAMVDNTEKKSLLISIHHLACDIVSLSNLTEMIQTIHENKLDIAGKYIPAEFNYASFYKNKPQQHNPDQLINKIYHESNAVKHSETLGIELSKLALLNESKIPWLNIESILSSMIFFTGIRSHFFERHSIHSIDIEMHNRELGTQQMDAVGWYTVFRNISTDKLINLIHNKDNIKQFMFTFIRNQTSLEKKYSAPMSHEIVYNHIGSVTESNAKWSKTLLDDNVSRSANSIRVAGIEIDSFIKNGEIMLEIKYDKEKHTDGIVEFVKNWKRNTALLVNEIDCFPLSTVNYNNTITHTDSLFFFHGADGSIANIAAISQLIDFPVHAFEFQYAKHATFATQIQNLIKYYVECIKSMQPSGPYYLAGHSFGAILARGVADHLVKDNEDVRCVIGIDDSLLLDWSKQARSRKDELIMMLSNVAINSNQNIDSFLGKSENDIHNELSKWVNQERIDEIIKNRDVLLNLISPHNLFDHISCKQIHATQTVANEKLNTISSQPYELVEGDHFSIFHGDSGKKLAGYINMYLHASNQLTITIAHEAEVQT